MPQSASRGKEATRALISDATRFRRYAGSTVSFLAAVGEGARKTPTSP